MKNMEILFINPFPYYAYGINEATIYPPIGMAYIAAVLEKNGFKSKIIDANILQMTNEKLLERIEKEDVKFIGISANVITSRAAKELCEAIKSKFPDKIIICGGPLPTTNPDYFLTFCDIVVRQEGELTTLDILKGKKLEKIDGISFKSEGKIIKNNPREMIKNLDGLPFPAYYLLEPSLEKYRSRARKKPVAPIITTRGCPYQCVYCNKGIFGFEFRKRSPENVLDEIDFLVKNNGVKQLDILDDNFTLDLERAEKICDMIIERKYNLALNCQNGVRVDRLTENLVDKMKKAGVFKVGIGIESGDEGVLKNIRKQLDLKNVKQVIKWFKKRGIIVQSSFMIGLPEDTPETMQKTIDFAKESNPHLAIFNMTIPFPGTNLFDYVKNNGAFLQNTNTGVSSGFFNSKAFYETNETKKDDVEKYYKKAYRDFYFRPGKVLDIISTLRSFSEFKWVIHVAIDTMKTLFRK